MKVVIDRFEGDFAVVELPDLTFVNVPRLLFPDAKEHDVIDISVDKQETESRKKRIHDLMNTLFTD
jgi:hypothetical protein